MRANNFRQDERGMALILSLLALLLISAVGLGLIYMSNTETSINSNYKDTQTAFFAISRGENRRRRNSIPKPHFCKRKPTPPSTASW